MSESLNKTSQKDQITENEDIFALSGSAIEEDLSFLHDDDEDDEREGFTR